ncbi:class I adenylate-forming enzyme family protein [Desulfosporosinus sp. PR]|uniref:class I adenylate-forming enzyme family protein n=1 Tax=Candidatus Desulfosporosinus nitrosoreducens TaxID=3401928 RepID=UPI0027FD0619|nr:class I adenylate-forming enzyme family protein [Desulfosporosinus sp. PR]MDQ7096364.1 class I adenylate-forming enzyme family protein [Desulfosporosinus sp. PR]
MVNKESWKERQAFFRATCSSWQRRTLADHFDSMVLKYQERPFIITRDKKYTYRETLYMVDLTARGLMALGIKAREHVALLMGNYVEFIFLTLALAKIGAVVVPFNFMLKEKEVKQLLQDSDAVALIFNDRLGRIDYIKIVENICPELKNSGTCPSGFAELPNLRQIVCYSPDHDTYQGMHSFLGLYDQGERIRQEDLVKRQADSAYPDDISHILYTSGTTGIPKGSLLSHDMLLRNAYISGIGRSVGDGQRTYCPLPLYHIFALVQGMLTATFAGGAIILDEQFSPGEALQLMDKNQAQEILCVPSILLALLNHPERKAYRLEAMRTLFCAATPAPVPIWERAKAEFGFQEMQTGYGMTEVSAATTMTSPEDSLEVLATRIGRLLPANCSGLPEFGGYNVQYKVVDPVSGEDLPLGSEGELVCRGNIVSKGYYKRPMENQALIDKDGWLRTGDFGIIQDGLFQLSGRSKEIYRVSGENVMPIEVEGVLTSFPKINQAYVVGIPDPILGEAGVAFIELKPGEQATRREVLEYLKPRLAKFKLPKYVFFMKQEKLPFTGSGKIQKFLLQEKAISLKQAVEKVGNRID